jgi:hypothetical protein
MQATSSSTHTNRDRVEAFVLEHRPRFVCARCISATVGLRPSAVQRVATLLEGSPTFSRMNAPCSLCGKNRLAVRVASESNGRLR